MSPMVWALWSAPVRVLLAQTHPEGPTSVGTAGAALCELLRVCEPEVGTPLAQVLSDSAIAATVAERRRRGVVQRTLTRTLEDLNRLQRVARGFAAVPTRRAVAEAARGQDVPLAGLSMRSTKMSGTTYMAFSCPQCSAVAGDMYVVDELMNSGYETPVSLRQAAARRIGATPSHWCVDRGTGHCATPPVGYAPRNPAPLSTPSDPLPQDVGVERGSARFVNSADVARLFARGMFG